MGGENFVYQLYLCADLLQAYTARRAERSSDQQAREQHAAAQTRQREHEQLTEQISRTNRYRRPTRHFSDGWVNAFAFNGQVAGRLLPANQHSTVDNDAREMSLCLRRRDRA